MEKAAKAEERIKRVCESLGITPGGRLWLDTALDPFKDIAQKPIGYPDMCMAPSVVQTVHDSFEISLPSGRTGNWDCNIFIDQVWDKVYLKKTTRYLTDTSPTADSQTGLGYARGGMVVRMGAAGEFLDIEKTENTLSHGLVKDVFDQETSARLLAIGFEVHNTTAELHKQGSVICYRVSDDPVKTIYTPLPDSGITITNNISVPAVELTEPPCTAGQAIDLYGSIQWDAAKGVYVVPTFAKATNDPADFRELVVGAKNMNDGSFYTQAISVVGKTTYIPALNVELPTTISGAFFTGLSEQSTLQVNVTYYVEQLPSYTSGLRRLCNKSCPEDFAALELYTKVVREMPTGVEVNQNFLAGFVSGISRIAQIVSRAAPTVLRGIGVAGQMLDVLSPDRSSEHASSLVAQTNVRRAPNVQQKQPSRDIIIKEPNNRQIVIHEGPQKQQQQQQSQPARRGQQIVKNRRDKDFNRLDTYYKAGNAGNKYIK